MPVKTNSPVIAPPWWRYPLLITGVAAAATAVIFIKQSQTHPFLLCAWRQLLAATFLSPLFFMAARRHTATYTAGHLRRCIIPALMLATHFISWTIGARKTDAANASLIVNLVPIVMPFLMVFMATEHLNRQEAMGTVLSLLGLGVLGAGSYRLRPENLPGDIICFFSMLLFALYLAYGRKNRDFPSLWLYLVPLYFFSGSFCLATGVISGAGWFPANLHEWLLMLALAVIPTLIGHSILNDAMQRLRGQVVSLYNLGQFIFAGILAYLLLDEVPTPPFWVAAVLIVAGAVVVIQHQPAPPPPPAPNATLGTGD